MSDSREQIRKYISDEVNLALSQAFKDRAADRIYAQLKDSEPYLLQSDIKQIIDEEVTRANDVLQQ